MSNQSPFVVENLTPKNSTGAPTATYELTKASVSPTRVVGRDSRGFPIEETVPTTYWRPFLMLDGGINKVPLRTGSVFSMQAEATAYETETVTELVSLGCIPAWLCPYSTKYAHITGGPFVPGGQDCGGKPEGCEHIMALSEARKARVREVYDAEAELMANKEAERYTKMTNSIVEGVGAAIARHAVGGQPGGNRKQALRDGKED